MCEGVPINREKWPPSDSFNLIFCLRSQRHCSRLSTTPSAITEDNFMGRTLLDQHFQILPFADLATSASGSTRPFALTPAMLGHHRATSSHIPIDQEL